MEDDSRGMGRSVRNQRRPPKQEEMKGRIGFAPLRYCLVGIEGADCLVGGRTTKELDDQPESSNPSSSRRGEGAPRMKNEGIGNMRRTTKATTDAPKARRLDAIKVGEVKVW